MRGAYFFGKISKRSFTLYEVLITIAIIAAMVSLLVPTVQKARDTASMVKCMGNLRSWGVAFQMHAAEHNGLYPKSFLNNSDNWTMWIAPYVELNWLYYEGPPTFAKRLNMTNSGCPYFVKLEHPNPSYRKFPYSYNGGRFDYPYYATRHIRGQMVENGVMWAVGWDISNGEWVGTAMRYGYGGWGGESSDHIAKYAHIPPTEYYKEPADSEVLFCGWASHWRYYAYPYQHWFSSPPSGNDYNVRTGDGYLGDYNQMPLGVHNGKDNYLMMDGHVESLVPTDKLVNWYVYNDVPARGNPFRNYETPGSGPIAHKGQEDPVAWR